MTPGHGLVDLWWSWMAPVSAQVLVMVAVAAALDRLLRRWARPRLLAAVWWMALVKLAVPPWWSSPVAVAELWSGSRGHSEAAASPSTTWVSCLFLAWLAGALGLAAASAAAHLRFCRMSRAGRDPGAHPSLSATAQRLAASMHLRIPPRLVLSVEAVGPAAAGIFRPVVLIPTAVAGAASTAQIEHILAHELAHVRRRDALAALVVRFFQIVYWFHPAVWWIGRRLGTLREIACDEAAIAARPGSAGEYRRTLLELARPLLGGRSFGLHAAAGFHSVILQRLRWLDRQRHRRSRASMVLSHPLSPALLCLALLVTCLPLGTGAAPAHPRPVRWDELQGCMQVRFAVFAAMAARENGGNVHNKEMQ